MAIKPYYELTKSGLVFGNLVTVIAGFMLAEGVVAGRQGLQPMIALPLLVATIAGICLVMASGCVFNNYIDRDIDAHMDRTRNRAIVTGRVSGSGALSFGTVLGIAGFGILFLFTNLPTVGAAALGFFFYVFMYSLWFKRRSIFGTVIGAIAGATPPVVGYCAVSGRIDDAAVILFFMLALWQLPHFYAIAIRRVGDYDAAGIPVFPIKRGMQKTKIATLLDIVAFVFTASLLTVFGYTGAVYLGITLVLGLAWIAMSASGFTVNDPQANTQWAKRMFFFSLAVMVILFATIAIGAIA